MDNFYNIILSRKLVPKCGSLTLACTTGMGICSENFIHYTEVSDVRRGIGRLLLVVNLKSLNSITNL